LQTHIRGSGRVVTSASIGVQQQGMPQLQWDHYAFIECLEVIPTVEEDDVSHYFQVERDDLKLDLTVWQYESTLQLDLWHKRFTEPIIGFALAVRSGVKHLKAAGAECLQFCDCVIVPGPFSYRSFGGYETLHDPAKLPGIPAVRLFVKPSIRVEIRSHAGPL
jgi:hypothetical protein